MQLRTARHQGTFMHEVRRFLMRAEIIRYGLLMAAFWTAVAVCLSWLVYFGLGWLAIGMLIVWAALSVPAVLVQSYALIDLVNYALSGQVHLMKGTLEWLRRYEQDPTLWEELKLARQQWREELALRPWPVRLVVRGTMVAWDVSPLLPLATWALFVLLRLPETQAVSRETAREAPEILKSMKMIHPHSPGRFAHG